MNVDRRKVIHWFLTSNIKSLRETRAVNELTNCGNAVDLGFAMFDTSTLCSIQGYLFSVRCLFVCPFYQANIFRKQNGHFTSKTTPFSTAISNRADDLLSAPLAFPSFNQGSSVVKGDSDIPTSSPSVVKELYSPNPLPFTSMIFCTTLPEAADSQPRRCTDIIRTFWWLYSCNSE